MGTQTLDLTVAVQDYLKSIYALESAGERVTTSALAGRMGVSAPSATAMAKRLAELGLVPPDPAIHRVSALPVPPSPADEARKAA